MARGTRPLSGAAKDGYLRRTLRAEPELTEATRDRIAARLQSEIASLSLRPAAASEMAADAAESIPPVSAPVNAPAPTAMTFDPYTPNVIVVIRTRGRDAVLAELRAISKIEDLRLLAREQQLGLTGELVNVDEICLAIVAAAERRIANRRAAAS